MAAGAGRQAGGCWISTLQVLNARAVPGVRLCPAQRVPRWRCQGSVTEGRCDSPAWGQLLGQTQGSLRCSAVTLSGAMPVLGGSGSLGDNSDGLFYLF